jgi:hypothetical protein
LESLGIENVGIFYDNFQYDNAIWYILWPFGIFFPVLGMFEPRNIWELGPAITDMHTYVLEVQNLNVDLQIIDSQTH